MTVDTKYALKQNKENSAQYRICVKYGYPCGYVKPQSTVLNVKIKFSSKNVSCSLMRIFFVVLHLQESSNGPVKKTMREKAIERRNINKEHNSNFKAGYVPIEEERLHKTGLRGRKGNMAVCIIVLLFLLALINLIVSLLARLQ